MKDDLNEGNFLLFCAKNYQNPSVTTDLEFMEDIRRLKYIKKLLTRFKTTGELKERLILNHLTVLLNVFGREAAVRIIWLKMTDYLSEMRPFLIALGVDPKKVMRVKGKNHDVDEIPLDVNIIAVLRKIPR